MLLYIITVAVAFFAVGLMFFVLAGHGGVRETMRLARDLLDLVKLLVTLRLKAAQVRGINW